MKRKGFNSVIVRDKASDKFVFIRFENGKLDSSYYRMDMPEGFVPSEEVKGVLPSNKVILSKATIKNDSDLCIKPKYCIELKIGKRAVNFWHMLDNPEYFPYLMSILEKKLNLPIDNPQGF